MADGFIVRKGGIATEQALAPTITQVATTETSITFTITNNDAETAIIRHRLDDITDEGEIVELATNATSANITVGNLADDTTFTVFATSNVTSKVKSNVTQLAISTNEIPAPTITLVSKTDTSITFTLKNNSVETRDVTFGLTTPPTTTTISLASDATSGNQTFSNLDDDTTFTIFAQAEGGLIGQLNVTTDLSLVFTAATGGTTLEYNSGGKRFKSHTFTSNGNFVVSTVGDNIDDRNKVDFLIIAGGGGGGSSHNSPGYSGAGGGAGGFRTTLGTSGRNSAARDKITITATTFGVTVGSGGNGGAAGGGNGVTGANSSVAFSTTISTAGGGFGARGTGGSNRGGNGGSGGGGTGASSVGTATGTADEGFDAAPANPSFNQGVGGAGVGGQPPGISGTTTRGNGGVGLANLLRTGSNETRAGGGGGGAFESNDNHGFGQAGGGNGGTNASKNGKNATANTGSGAGGGHATNTSAGGSSSIGGNGGSGIVVIRYEIATV